VRAPLSGLSFFGVGVAAVIALLAEPGSSWQDLASAVGVALMLGFVALEIRSVKPLHVWTSLILFSLGITAILAVSGLGLESLKVLYQGLVRNLQYLLLFASIVWLQVQATQSPSLLELRERAMRMPGGRRSVSIMLVAYVLGSAFNIAAFGLMSPLIQPQTTPQPLRERLLQAVSKGFMLATSWSPLFVGTAVILASVDGVRWTDVGLGGFVLGGALLVAQWVFDGIYRRLDPSAAKARALFLAREPVALRLGLRATLVRAGLIILTLFSVLFVAVAVLKLRIPVALALAAPVFGLSWAWTIRREVGSKAHGPVRSVGEVFAHYPTLRGEALLFAAANVFAIGIQGVLAQRLGEAGQSLSTILGWSEPALLLACILGFFIICVLGMHPLVSVILLTTLFVAADLGLEPWQFAVMMMALWGTGTNASPVSASSILMGRMTELSNWRVAWRLNLPFSLVNVVVICAAFLLLQALN